MLLYGAMWILAACMQEPLVGAGPTPGGTGDPPADTGEPPDQEIEGGDDDDDPPDDTGKEEEDEPYPRACPDIYAQDLLPEYFLEISDEEWAKFHEDYSTWTARAARGEDVKPWHDAISFTYQGEEYADVKVRLKGNPCCSWVGDKYQFRISFTEVDPDARFHGVRGLALDAPYYEQSFLHERLAASYQADLGLPALCVNNAKLFVNGVYFGLYSNVEVPDEEYLQRQFGKDDATGNLYKYDYTFYRWEQDEGDGDWTDHAELYAITSFEDFEEIGDEEQNILHWAADAVMPNIDGYWVGSINFMLYDHPERGWMMVPWDQDGTFWPGTFTYDPAYRSDYWGLTLPFDLLLASDPSRYYSAVEAARDQYDPGTLSSRVAEWSAQIRDAAREDPKKYFSNAEFDATVVDLERFPRQRREYLDLWVPP